MIATARPLWHMPVGQKACLMSSRRRTSQQEDKDAAGGSTCEGLAVKR